MRALESAEVIRGLFDEMHISADDYKLLDAISKQGEATTEERAPIDQFVAEYERAFNMVSQAQNSFRLCRMTFRYLYAHP